MREIISRVKVVSLPPEETECPMCHTPVSHYNPLPRLEIDFDDIVQKIEAISEIFPNEDVINIVLLIDQEGDIIYGHPVRYKGGEQ